MARSESSLGRPLENAPQGFVLPEYARRAFSTRLMLQAPHDASPRELAAIRRDLDSRVKGLPQGAFMALDSLRLLADQGNAVAADLFDSECRRLGLVGRFTSYRR